jgi:hypothetical protein
VSSLARTPEQAVVDGYTPAVRKARAVCQEELASEMKTAIGV